MIGRRALVREPGDSYGRCISSHPLRHMIDLKLAREQHRNYCRILGELGLEVIHLPRDDLLPDSCFVEDNAVIHGDRALICRMARESRRGEEEAVEEFLKGYLRVKRATPPATVEGGDVIHLRDRLISGVTERTNMEGVAQMRDWLEVPVDIIVDPRIVHLKSYVTYLGDDVMIATRPYARHPALEGFRVLVVPDEEAYAANTLTIGETVLMPEGCPRSHEIVREAGFDVIPLSMTEFEKCEGALTCLSLIF
ncbi:amidinotransferase [Candidatus Bathyarchaeota archaeon]|nr:amidinotransferase [Candidatus Bathyarchaeota archaeon]